MTNSAIPPATAAFSSNTDFTESAIDASEPVHSASAGTLFEQYEISETVSRIKKGGYRKVRLVSLCAVEYSVGVGCTDRLAIP